MKDKKFDIQLFIVENTALSEKLIQKVQSALQKLVPGEYNFKSINILDHPEKALQYQIMASPTLVVKSQNKQQCILGGDISDEETLKHLLENF